MRKNILSNPALATGYFNDSLRAVSAGRAVATRAASNHNGYWLSTPRPEG
jgi:hypothetical protein